MYLSGTRKTTTCKATQHIPCKGVCYMLGCTSSAKACAVTLPQPTRTATQPCNHRMLMAGVEHSDQGMYCYCSASRALREILIFPRASLPRHNTSTLSPTLNTSSMLRILLGATSAAQQAKTATVSQQHGLSSWHLEAKPVGDQ